MTKRQWRRQPLPPVGSAAAAHLVNEAERVRWALNHMSAKRKGPMLKSEVIACLCQLYGLPTYLDTIIDDD
jgi:hypothetical protein